mmetsp:Transcript_11535/g.22691  ORF Transcript_11535/g.22691 Transcript_11535/m.22691 type:complete len:513 (-) Transcript_11535:407-1945(-)|eukprot:CAMPEP_0171511466 /NCGR_PEP_ID=MMETSP0959-20130129/1007_1 /TAXON_ID=87120 /ORGANISM="Aurantiochytrium limacinum, Strain ATCCMYA-1381" /LENGTH=512 /DNA_ID=CAMNT_0012049089 /DNA_START=34 /DNA_END=1572 /DNA_ORIENTATION=+
MARSTPDEARQLLKSAQSTAEASAQTAQGEQLVQRVFAGDEAAQELTYATAAEVVRAAGEENEFPEDVAQLALQVSKLALCERVEAMKVLCEGDVLAGFCRLAVKHLGSTSAHDALKCLNNAMYEQRFAQQAFCDLPEDQGAKVFAKVLAQKTDLEALRLAGAVGMMLVASSTERSTDAPVSSAFVSSLVPNLLDILADHHPSSTDNRLDLFPESTSDRGMALRAGLTSCLKLIYAVMVTQPNVFANQASEAQASRQELSTSQDMLSEEKTLAAFMDNLSLDSTEVSTVDRFGLAVTEVLRVTAPQNASTEELKSLSELWLQATSIAMLACAFDGFPDLFVHRGGLEGLLDILDVRTQEIANYEADPARAVQHVGELLPYIIACTQTVQMSPVGCSSARSRVFPEELPSLEQDDAESDKDFEARIKKRQMHGTTPKDVLGGRLIPFLTCLESSLKRCVGELLFALCRESPDEFTRRCGYGNAAHMLAIKGGMIGQILEKQEEEQARRQAQDK